MQAARIDYLGAYLYTNKNGAIIDSAFNHNGTYLAVCNTTGQIYIYPTTGGQSKLAFKTYQQHKGAVLKICWSNSKDKFYLASCSIDRTVKIYNQEQLSLTIDTKEVIPTSIMFVPVQQIILTVGVSSGDLKLYNLKGHLVFSIPMAHQSAISYLQWNYQFQKSNVELLKRNFHGIDINQPKILLATGSSDTNVKIWQLTKVSPVQLKLLSIITTHVKQIRSISWKPSIVEKYCLLTTASDDGFLKMWEVRAQQKSVKQIFSQKLGKSIWKAGWDQFGNLLCVSLLSQENINETYIFQFKQNRLIRHGQVKQIQQQ